MCASANNAPAGGKPVSDGEKDQLLWLDDGVEVTDAAPEPSHRPWLEESAEWVDPNPPRPVSSDSLEWL